MYPTVKVSFPDGSVRDVEACREDEELIIDSLPRQRELIRFVPVDKYRPSARFNYVETITGEWVAFHRPEPIDVT